MNQPVKFRAVLLIEGLASSGMTLGEASPGVPVAGGWEKMRTKTWSLQQAWRRRLEKKKLRIEMATARNLQFFPVYRKNGSGKESGQQTSSSSPCT